MGSTGTAPDTFEERVLKIYRSTIDGLWAAAASWAPGDRRLAEDLVQETWLRAVRHWRRQGVPEHPAAWLRTVARNLAISHARRSGREIAADDPESAARPARQSDSESVDGLTLAAGLAHLTPRNAAVLRSFHLEGRSVREIADEQSLSERAVEGRLRRARQTLRRLLGADTQERQR